MGQALYRTYRSRALSELVGQEHITDTLARAIKAGRISHAYLFTGPRGTGKTSVARILAHEINGLPYADTPNLDIVEIDAASNRRIDDIRDLREKVHIAPVSAKYKVYIIDEVHMLTGESFNALLKTLEEPPAHVVFILATTEVHKLPATIISRTQRYAFRPGSRDKMVAHLGMIAQKEGITITPEALDTVAEHGEGSFRDSVSLLDQLSHITTGEITAQHVADSLGLAPKEQISAIISALSAGDTPAIMAALAALESQGSNVAAIVNQLCKELLASASDEPRFLPLIDGLLEVPRAYQPHLKLVTTLARFASEGRPTQKVAPTRVSAAPPTTIAQVAPTTTQPPTPPPENPTPQVPEPTPPMVTPTEPLQTMNLEDWGKVLAAMKQKSPPIYSVLKQAQPTVDGAFLVLSFKFALHSKKLDDAKQKALVVAVMQEALGRTAEVKIAVNKDAAPLVVAEIPAATPQPASPHVADITAIMGGGEVIHGTTI